MEDLFSLENIMMLAFALAFIFSMGKLYMFMPNKPLEDDDTTSESVETLIHILEESVCALHKEQLPLEEQELYERICEHEKFDKKHFWRFNQNRLRQLIQNYYLRHPEIRSLEQIARKKATETSDV